jgi:hypothetical protein
MTKLIYRTPPNPDETVLEYRVVEYNCVQTVLIVSVYPNATGTGRDIDSRTMQEISIADFRLGYYNQKAKLALEELLKEPAKGTTGRAD